MPLDIAIGIFISLFVTHAFSIHASALLVILGIGAALFPDLDNVIPQWRRAPYDHRNVLHWPLAYIPLSLVVFLVFGNMYGTLFSLGVLWHLVHDTVGIGWGVTWLAPFSMRKFMFPESGRRREYGWFMTWLPDEEAAMAAKWHDPHWLRNWYFTPNWLVFTECVALVCSIIALAAYYLT